MGITINGKQYASANDAGVKGTWEKGEVTPATGTDTWGNKLDILSMVSLTELMNAASYTGTADWSLETLLDKAGDVPETFSEEAQTLGDQIEESTKKLEALDNAKTELKDKISIVKDQIATLKKATPPDAAALAEAQEKLVFLESALAHTDEVLSALINKLKTEMAKAEDDNDALEENGEYQKRGNDKTLVGDQLSLRDAFQALKQRIGVVGSKLQDALDAKAAGKPGAKAAAGGGSGAGDAGDAPRSGARAAAGGGPFGQARAGGGGFPPLDMNALLMSNYMQQNQLEGQDAMHKTENESKRMMLLFFMLARMAMSGDVGAMYQFLRFIGHIVNKDKAMQNVQLARKLIELQDVSRKLTQMLVDAPAHDEDDQGVQAEYMKLQQKVQAEQGVIATSQKLIAQMLEEFTQVSEMMTGMVKSLLDARGRELSMLAVWRA